MDGHADESSVYYPPRITLQKDASRLWFLFENNPTMYFIVDAEGRILSANRYGAEHLGYEVSELIGTHVLDLVHEDDRAEVQSNFAACTSRPGEVCRWDFRKVRKDGSIIWIHEMVRPVLDENGEFIILVVCDDVTATRQLTEEREHLLEAERRAREQVSAILESISDAFLAVDRHWRFTYMNRRGRELVETIRGDGSGEIIGRPLPDVLPGIWTSEFGAYHRLAMAERHTVHHEAYFPPLGRWLQVHDYPSAEGLSIYVQDITDRKQAEEERERLFRAEREARAEAQQQREALERITESRTHLMRGFSHDVKNPLGAAEGYAALPHHRKNVSMRLSCRRRAVFPPFRACWCSL
ncbi:MAG TPA: PAS domain S-box protein [Longimicrobiales bacterium]|nr:PAS domain S-box protein [Longimicrobiales bacterium]